MTGHSDVSPGAYGFLAALLAADVAAFSLQRLAAQAHGPAAAAFLWAVVRQPALWIAVSLAPIQLWLWTRVLKRADISWAYPVTALAYPITMIVASLAFHERYDWHVWVGAALVTAGAIVIGPPKKTDPAQGVKIRFEVPIAGGR